MSTLDAIKSLPVVAAATATIELPVFDKGASNRTGKATGAQLKAYLQS